jgi:putative selenium metabolism protein SsnA
VEQLLIENGTVVTLGERNRILEGHDVLVQGETVARIAPHGTFQAGPARRLDASGFLVLPGFINVHMHFYSTLVRGFARAVPAKSFSEVLAHLWWRLDRALSLEDVYISAKVALLEAVRHGTTTLIDHHASPGAVTGSLHAIARAVKEVGLRASLCYELSDRDGGEVAEAGLEENAAFLEWCRAAGDSRLAALFGLHASFTLSDETLQRAAQLAADLGAGFHVHVAEAPCDQEHCLAEHGCRVVERLHRHGVLGPRSVAAHCVHIDARERELLAASNTAVAHCPQSNANNAVGIADVLALERAGVLVGLGTDAVTVDMREELRAALWLRHLAAQDPSAGFVETCSLLLDGNRLIAERCWPGLHLGQLVEGGAADLILLDYHPPTPFDATTFLGHLLFGLAGARVDTTIVGGRVVMAQGQLAAELDAAAVAAEARERARQLWERL